MLKMATFSSSPHFLPCLKLIHQVLCVPCFVRDSNLSVNQTDHMFLYKGPATQVQPSSQDLSPIHLRYLYVSQIPIILKYSVSCLTHIRSHNKQYQHAYPLSVLTLQLGGDVREKKTGFSFSHFDLAWLTWSFQFLVKLG